MKKRHYIFLIVFLCFNCLAYGQPQKILTEYSTDNGLSISSINDFLFDQNGFFWIATPDGLQRFDGYRFQTFKHNASDTNSLPSNSPTTLYEDDRGNIWITHYGGTAVKPKGTFQFINIPASPQLVNGYQHAILFVGETDSCMLVLYYPNGIFSINKKTLQQKKVFSIPGSFAENGIAQLSRLRAKNEDLWFRKKIDAASDLLQLTPSGFHEFRNEKKINVLFLIEEKDSLVVITDKMIYKTTTGNPFETARMLQENFNSKDLDNRFVTLPYNIGIREWVLMGTDKILMYDANREAIVPFPYNNYFSPSSNKYLKTTILDKHENIWLGYNGVGGIKVLSKQKFEQFKRTDKTNLPYAMTGDEQGNIYVGIYLGNIEVYDKDGNFLHSINLPAVRDRYSSPRGMAFIDSETLIVKSVTSELYAIDINKNKVKVISQLLPEFDLGYTGDFEPSAQKIKDGELWFSYKKNIVSLQKNKNGFFTKIICTLPFSERITSFLYKNGQLWVGTISGVWYFQNNSFKKLSDSGGWIKQINQHPDGKLWVATTDGVFILENNKLVKRLNEKDGLPNSFVYSVLFDDAANVWISTNRGLAKINPSNIGDSSWRITTYSGKEGLQGDEFNTKGYYKGYDGTLYFAGVNGINFFKPQDLVNKSGPSQTMLTKIDVNNLPYLPKLQPEFINELNLPHDQNNISLSFSCMDFTVSEKNQYRFWLKGFQNDWSLPQTNNTVQYILPPGEYQLLVLGSNYEGVWSKEPLVLNINIFPPWYQTSLAEIIFLLVALGVVGGSFYFFSRNRYQKKLRKLQMEQEVQKEKQRLSRDLHDNLGSQITWLSNNITQLERAEVEHRPVETKLNQLKEGAGELMQTLRETIWILNKDKISCVDLFDKVVSLAARHIEVCPPLQLHTEENILDNLQLNSSQALQIFRICQEAINNVCKHSQASELTIRANSSNNHFTISVSDNGRGFLVNENGLDGHYGLQNMKERAKETNLELGIQSSPAGTTIIISL